MDIFVQIFMLQSLFFVSVQKYIKSCNTDTNFYLFLQSVEFLEDKIVFHKVLIMQ